MYHIIKVTNNRLQQLALVSRASQMWYEELLIQLKLKQLSTSLELLKWIYLNENQYRDVKSKMTIFRSFKSSSKLQSSFNRFKFSLMDKMQTNSCKTYSTATIQVRGSHRYRCTGCKSKVIIWNEQKQKDNVFLGL